MAANARIALRQLGTRTLRYGTLIDSLRRQGLSREEAEATYDLLARDGVIANRGGRVSVEQYA